MAVAVWQLSLKLSLLIFIFSSTLCCCAVAVSCVKDDACKCTLDDGSKEFFDLSKISSRSTSTNEPYFQVGAPGRVDYYDPCEPFTVNDSNSVCNGVAGCHLEVGEDQNTYSNIAKHDRVIFNYNEEGGNLVLHYDNGAPDHADFITLTVVLICKEDTTQDTLEIEDYTSQSYRYLLVSPYSCVQKGGGGNGGLSFGSILCIIFCVCVFVYLIGGFIFMAVVQKKSGKEAIPNYGFWIEVPGLIKDGAIFSTSCVPMNSSSGHQTLPGDNQEGSDAFSGEGNAGSNKNAYDAI